MQQKSWEMSKGKVPWNKGLKMSKEFGMKISLANKRRKPLIGIPHLKMRGANHYNWKGGSTHGERVKFRDTMQKMVFKRDNYTCQLCKKRGVDLQVDHIQSWAEYVELRFSMDNCRTICAQCHYQITFGKPMPKNIKGWGHNLFKKGVQGL